MISFTRSFTAGKMKKGSAVLLHTEKSLNLFSSVILTPHRGHHSLCARSLVLFQCQLHRVAAAHLQSGCGTPAREDGVWCCGMFLSRAPSCDVVTVRPELRMSVSVRAGPGIDTNTICFLAAQHACTPPIALMFIED